jgi:hypothetical protein
MKVLHVVPGDSAGGSLKEAIRAVGYQQGGYQQEVLSFCDDLSCGPIAWGTSRERAAWWSHIHGPRLPDDFEAFWHRLETADERLVVWFGRHSASELAFFLALADRLGERPYDIVDVTDLKWTIPRPDGTSAITRPAGAVGIVPTDRLMAQLGTASPVPPQEARLAGSLWQHLRTQNAPFRVVTPTGLASAPLDHFDSSILGQAAKEWRNVAYVIGSAMAHNREPYIQVGSVMLLTRLVALVEEGMLLADGDPWDMRACRVRLPD